MKVEDGNMVIPVSPQDFRSIDRAMMLMDRSKWGRAGGLGRTDGELLAAICRAWSEPRGGHVEPSEGLQEVNDEPT
jgi:hypothetical protein